MAFALSTGMQQALEVSGVLGILRIEEAEWLLRRLNYAATLFSHNGERFSVELTFDGKCWECVGELFRMGEGERELEIRLSNGAWLIVRGYLTGRGNVRRFEVRRIDCRERRVFPRVSLPKGVLWLEYRCGIECFRYRVLDISPFGLRMVGDDHRVQVNRGGKATLVNGTQACEIEFDVCESSGSDQRLRIRRETKQESVRWLSDFYHRTRHPEIRDQNSDDIEQLCELFLSCGYMQLCSDQVDWTNWKKDYPQGPNSFNRVYVQSPGDIVGHLSLSHFGDRSMVVHQLAVSNSGRLSAKVRIQMYIDAILRCAEKNGPEGLLTFFFNPEKRWHQLFFSGFASRMANPKQIDVCYWDRYVWRIPSNKIDDEVHVNEIMNIDSIEFDSERVNGLKKSIAYHSSDLNQRFLMSCIAPSRQEKSIENHETIDLKSLPVGRAYRFCSKDEPDIKFYLLHVSTSRNLSLFGLFDQIWIIPEPRTAIPSSSMIFAAIDWIWSTRAYVVNTVPIIFAPPRFLQKQLSQKLNFVERVGCFFLKSNFVGQVYRFLELQKTRLMNQTEKRSSIMNNGNELFENYQQQMQESRSRLKNHPLFSLIESEGCTKKQLLRLLIKHSAHSQIIVRPVESWILEASRRCGELGMVRIAEYFKRHSKEEAGHDKMLENDLVFLIDMWNSCFDPKMSVEQTKCDHISSGMLGFIDLHEQTLKSPYPHMQIAIEYEIELLSVLLIPSVLTQTERLLGRNVVDSLSFLGSHLNLDVHHTKANEKVLRDLLVERPGDFDRLVQAGKQALECYSEIFDQFVILAGNYNEPEIPLRSGVARETAKQLLA